MAAKTTKKATGYDKYVNWKIFFIPVALLFAILFMPTPYGMKDVGTEYKVGPKAVINFITKSLFEKKSEDAEQWELICAQIMEQNVHMGALGKNSFWKRDLKWAKSYKIQADKVNFEKALAYVTENVSDEAFLDIMQKALTLRKDGLKYEELSDRDRSEADKGAWAIKVAMAMVVFVVICFLTECIPLPGVAFCIGLLLVFTGVVSRKEVTMLYWDDAVWFIMGSLMFAAAFVKTGVDKRACLMMFSKLAMPNVRWITLIFFVIISPLAAFISDHALAAMFLPIGMLLYQNSLTRDIPDDPELGKMLMITIAMAGAIAYLFAGVTNWRDYQERVDWGVVWLYAGAMIFGRILDSTGAAYWIARSILELLAPIGVDSGLPLLAASSGLTSIVTNLMADGPAAAAVGPVTLNIAGLAHPASAYLPFMAMVTAISSSFAYCLIIGTPPNAIVYASGYLEPKDYLRVGLPLWILSQVLLVVLVGVFWQIIGFGDLPGF